MDFVERSAGPPTWPIQWRLIQIVRIAVALQLFRTDESIVVAFTGGRCVDPRSPTGLSRGNQCLSSYWAAGRASRTGGTFMWRSSLAARLIHPWGSVRGRVRQLLIGESLATWQGTWNQPFLGTLAYWRNRRSM